VSRRDPHSTRAPLPPILRGRKLSEVVAREILKDAMRRGIPPGSRLASEGEMVETLEVGRGSLREALRILEVQGLLTIRPGPGGGPILKEVSSRDFGNMSSLYYMVTGATYREVIDARMSMNPLLARMAAARRAPEAQERLSAAIENTASVMNADDRTWLVTASEFYPVVGDLSGNHILAMFASSLQDIYSGQLPPVARDRSLRRDILAGHRAIAAAIVRGNAPDAERLTAAAMEDIISRIARAFPGYLDQPVDWQ
jgi:GntR family transcriptional repressor for pyruvate dehydrogenase complex